VVQSTILYIVSLRVFVALHVVKHISVTSASTVAFVSYLFLTVVFAEVFHWVVDGSSTWFARQVFEWSRT